MATEQGTVVVVCRRCGRDCVPTESTPGYGTDAHGDRFCLACCGLLDAEAMTRDGRITLYYDRAKDLITNWPGTLKIQAGARRVGRHNIAGTMRTVYFRGPDGALWSGRIYGENTQLLHCRRLKGRR